LKVEILGMSSRLAKARVRVPRSIRLRTSESRASKRLALVSTFPVPPLISARIARFVPSSAISEKYQTGQQILIRRGRARWLLIALEHPLCPIEQCRGDERFMRVFAHHAPFIVQTAELAAAPTASHDLPDASDIGHRAADGTGLYSLAQHRADALTIQFAGHRAARGSAGH
jgi:hypothetical protein